MSVGVEYRPCRINPRDGGGVHWSRAASEIGGGHAREIYKK